MDFAAETESALGISAVSADPVSTALQLSDNSYEKSSTNSTVMSKSCFLAVYSDIVGSIWTGEVDLNQPAGHLRREVYGECLQGLLPPGTSSAQLSLYYVVRTVHHALLHLSLRPAYYSGRWYCV